MMNQIEPKDLYKLCVKLINARDLIMSNLPINQERNMLKV